MAPHMSTHIDPFHTCILMSARAPACSAIPIHCTHMHSVKPQAAAVCKRVNWLSQLTAQAREHVTIRRLHAD